MHASARKMQEPPALAARWMRLLKSRAEPLQAFGNAMRQICGHQERSCNGRPLSRKRSWTGGVAQSRRGRMAT
jgi:hypothetical protein